MFHGWENFFYLIGSAGAGLIGLLFVVMTLTSGSERSQVQRGQSLYMTPTALHFAMVLSISAVALMPRLGNSAKAAVFGFAAFVGLANAARACVGMRSTTNRAHWSDFWLYGAAPTAIYLGLAVAAAALWAGVDWAIHAIALLLLALLLVGVRNAWDLITWIAPKRGGETG